MPPGHFIARLAAELYAIRAAVICRRLRTGPMPGGPIPPPGYAGSAARVCGSVPSAGAADAGDGQGVPGGSRHDDPPSGGRVACRASGETAGLW